MSAPPRSQTALLTLLALVAFAANSLLTRMALAPRLIDPAGFTLLRLASGALVLAALVRVQSGTWSSLGQRELVGWGRWVGPLALFGYAAPFTLAYVRIGAAVGALVLFGSVQVTMIGWGIVTGERLSLPVWSGLLLSAGGLVTLVLPSAARPDPAGCALMVLAGVAWGVYSLRGKASASPLAANARSFLVAVPLALPLYLVLGDRSAATTRGLLLAVMSGSLTSGVGYAIWYRALPGLTAAQAGIVQLSVPVLAAIGAITWLGERPTARLAIASVAVIGGVALAVAVRARPAALTPARPSQPGSAAARRAATPSRPDQR